MKPADAIPTALEKIAAILREEDYFAHAADIDALREAALSNDQRDQDHFRSEITRNKWYWLGMGTIADISFSDRELNSRFKRAYHELAMACDESGFGSIYSRDVVTIYGGWIKGGHV
jgi:hypothetical protein